LDDQVENLLAILDFSRHETYRLATVLATRPDEIVMRDVLKVRLVGSELALRAA
jgi:hypothetical protein